MWWLNILIFFVFVVTIILVVLRRGLQMKDLVHSGTPATAKIIRKRVYKLNTYLLYEFKTLTGKRFRRSSLVSQEAFDSVQEGSDFEIVYLIKNPKVSGPKYLVEQSREALKKRVK